MTTADPHAPVHAALDKIHKRYRFDSPPTSVLMDTPWWRSEHTLHELAHAYLLGLRLLRWPAWNRAFNLFGGTDATWNTGSTIIQRKLRFMSGEPGSQHEVCTCAVVYRVLCALKADDPLIIAQWMDNVVNPDLQSYHYRELGWQSRVNEPGVLTVAADILEELERLL